MSAVTDPRGFTLWEKYRKRESQALRAKSEVSSLDWFFIAWHECDLPDSSSETPTWHPPPRLITYSTRALLFTSDLLWRLTFDPHGHGQLFILCHRLPATVSCLFKLWPLRVLSWEYSECNIDHLFVLRKEINFHRGCIYNTKTTAHYIWIYHNTVKKKKKKLFVN